MFAADTLYTLQIVAFRGVPRSLDSVADGVLRKNPRAQFLAVLEPGEDTTPLHRLWLRLIQPSYPGANLFVIRQSDQSEIEGIVAFVAELQTSLRRKEADLLFLSETNGFWESRGLARWLQRLKTKLDEQVGGCVVRRV